ncbi:hypothetical protein NP233_g11077 [Leucocoprinus birnbaumii]|uniref:C2H2-type domain-containing protein n=1 Tax=Leucocoprinus birnbaumii TaxID=56174 RepID=A0AAD5YRA4_9AGAR|nr:hypothetical protein NP233_g11077 [Leucocoprinus birnbaumii]
MDSDHNYSFSLINPDEGERTAFGWGDIRSPIPSADNSPLSDFGHDFSDVELGLYQSGDSPILNPMDDSMSSSTALIRGLGNIDLASHRGKSNFPVPIERPAPNGRTAVACKIEPLELNGQWGSSGSAGAWPPGSGKYPPVKSEYTPQLDRIYRSGPDLSIDTDCFSPGSVIDPDLLSGLSDHSTINSTPLHSSSSPEKNRQERIWASASAQHQLSPYTSSSQRKYRASSFSKSDTVEFLTRKRAASDSGRLPPSTDNNPGGPSVLPDSGPFLNVSRHGAYAQPYTWAQQRSQPQSSSDYGNTNRPAGAVHLTDDQVRTPPFVYHHHQASLHSPAQDTHVGVQVAPSPSLTTRVSPGFRPHVASEAVVKAAQKKRRNRDGAKTFDCHLCPQQLTTKQNLQFHIAAHMGKRDYFCDRCGKSFTTPHTRTRHVSRCRNGFNLASGPSA